MPQTFYVTQDEEILSIVGRLRSSELLENVFVVPKRALILQSIVNLRILAREAEKLGKVVVIVTQDEGGRSLAEKAGIKTRVYAEETVPAGEAQVTKMVSEGGSIGSDDFYGRESVSDPASPVMVDHSQPTRTEPNHIVKVGVRGVAPSGPLPARPPRTSASESVRTNMNQQVVERSAPGEVVQREAERPVLQGDRAERLSQVFRRAELREKAAAENRAAKRKTSPETQQVGAKGKFWFIAFSVVSGLSLLATALFVLLPKAEIIIVPQSVSQDTEMEFEGKTSDPAGEGAVPVRLIRKEGEVSVTIASSGASAGSGEKARGKVVIYNEYGSDSQQLVATTRLESSDGKIFRLAKGVTVPGMSTINGKKEPGAVEADVIADEAGDAYNIGAATFTIPGFKGGPKYEKFSAKSQGAMTGGSLGSGGGALAVSASDIASAKTEAEKKFRSIFEEMVKSELKEGERYIMDSAGVDMAGTHTAPPVGTVVSSFDYSAKFSGSILVFSEKDLEKIAVETLRKRPSVGESFILHSMSFAYGDSSADYSSGVLRLKARVSAVFVSNIDIDAVRTDFLGKSGDEIRQVLEKHPEIKKLEVIFTPKLLLSSIPENKDRVSVKVELP